MKTKEEIEQLAEKNFPIEEYPTNEGFEHFAYKQGYTQCQNDMADTSKITRFEVIDENGRVYTRRNCKVELSYQDDGRTLKVFINSLNKQDNEN
jgi:hypothetical protein